MFFLKTLKNLVASGVLSLILFFFYSALAALLTDFFGLNYNKSYKASYVLNFILFATFITFVFLFSYFSRI